MSAPRVLPLFVVLLLCLPLSALAYVGPGAGFALLGSLVGLLTAVFAGAVAALLWPLRRLRRAWRQRAQRGAAVQRLIVLEFAPGDMGLPAALLAAGELPALQSLAAGGTGAGPALPTAAAFWQRLGDAAVPVIALGLPIEPLRFPGFLLAVPPSPSSSLSFAIPRPRSRNLDLSLPPPVWAPEAQRLAPLPLKLAFDAGPDGASLCGTGWRHPLRVGEPTPWLRLRWSRAWRRGASGLARFCLQGDREQPRLYVTAIQPDPRRSPLPLSVPGYAAAYCARLLGDFATLGPEGEHGALAAGELDLATAKILQQDRQRERERALLHVLARAEQGIIACRFDAPAPEPAARRAALLQLDATIAALQARLQPRDVLLVWLAAESGGSLWRCSQPPAVAEQAAVSLAPMLLASFGLAAPPAG